MFALHCSKCGHEWRAMLNLDTRCPNCRTMRPFLDYEAEDPVPPRLEIYSAPIPERLDDLARAVRMAQNMVDHPDMTRPYVGNPEGLKEGEFAIGNWIVRPRF